MHSPLPRREFLKCLSSFGATCVSSCVALRLAAEEAKPGESAAQEKLPDLKNRAYCGLICGDWCELFKATKAGDPAAKRAIYEKWGWKEKFGVDFAPDRVFCYGCKAPGKPENIAHAQCTVLKCCVARRLESCLECTRLAVCDKKLWQNYPDFRQQMLKLQQKYAATDGFKLR
ncbi:MAG TPA: DUF3795 domain-containing protein [Opitutaceae bacterium]|nr:DUF3795 domain-containing protein [Opitutaceae bacterium]